MPIRFSIPEQVQAKRAYHSISRVGQLMRTAVGRHRAGETRKVKCPLCGAAMTDDRSMVVALWRHLTMPGWCSEGGAGAAVKAR